MNTDFSGSKIITPNTGEGWVTQEVWQILKAAIWLVAKALPPEPCLSAFVWLL